MDVTLSRTSLSSVTADGLKGAVVTAVTGELATEQQGIASFEPELIVEGAVTIDLTGDVTDAAFIEKVRALAEAEACKGQTNCKVEISSTTVTSSRMRRLAAGKIAFKITRSLFAPDESASESTSSTSTRV